MKLYLVALGIFLKTMLVENRMLPRLYSDITKFNPNAELEQNWKENKVTGSPFHKVLGIKENLINKQDKNEDYFYNRNQHLFEPSKQQCSILVMSNNDNSNAQSLLRKYRYNRNGKLIPNSIQYFIKFPQGKSGAVLVPLEDKSFSAVGGFIKYYKEVPPIPHSWNR